jgi:chorismate-pyruvate lyase
MTPPAGIDTPVRRAGELAALFCRQPDEFGSFVEVRPADVPQPARDLLDHQSHMTVAMERHHGGPVGLRVVAERVIEDGRNARYAREILLVGPDGGVVQHGIVRIDLAALPAETAAAIRAARVPLGRILIEAGLLCDVQNVRLVRVEPGPHLAALLGGGATTFGRVAEIGLGGRPAIELLEIVAAAR